MDLKLNFIECYDSDFKGKKYKIGVFCNYYTGLIYRSVGLDCSNLEYNQECDCHVEYANRKFRITKINK